MGDKSFRNKCYDAIERMLQTSAPWPGLAQQGDLKRFATAACTSRTANWCYTDIKAALDTYNADTKAEIASGRRRAKPPKPSRSAPCGPLPSGLWPGNR